MLGHGVGNFVAHDHGQPVFILRDGQNAGVHGHLAAGHAPSVLLLVVLNGVELPAVAGQLLGGVLLAEIRFYGPLNALAHAPGEGRLLRVGGEAALGQHLPVLLGGEGVDFGVGDQTELPAAGDGHRRAGGQQGQGEAEKGFFQHE